MDVRKERRVLGIIQLQSGSLSPEKGLYLIEGRMLARELMRIGGEGVAVVHGARGAFHDINDSPFTVVVDWMWQLKKVENMRALVQDLMGRLEVGM
ncbi:unnamed protein product [Darwinula stevensoni]|uniref:Uncharacterized protein n=1 Tax=Darwinula stevensoni TaxID=69355 RepID=A0A7R9FRC6_9CRUS|nr:unnamed protein product [Darwinula stevensoni]CAG0901416.1 unnamed protein product [Darwinula stevensoni]